MRFHRTFKYLFLTSLFATVAVASSALALEMDSPSLRVPMRISTSREKSAMPLTKQLSTYTTPDDINPDTLILNAASATMTQIQSAAANLRQGGQVIVESDGTEAGHELLREVEVKLGFGVFSADAVAFTMHSSNTTSVTPIFYNSDPQLKIDDLKASNNLLHLFHK